MIRKGTHSSDAEALIELVAAPWRAEGRPVEEIEREHYTGAAAHGQWVALEEVVRAALYYASDLSSAITGDRMKVDCERFWRPPCVAGSGSNNPRIDRERYERDADEGSAFAGSGGT